MLEDVAVVVFVTVVAERRSPPSKSFVKALIGLAFVVCVIVGDVGELNKLMISFTLLDVEAVLFACDATEPAPPIESKSLNDPC